jgi:hypothetical protein
VIGVLIWYGLKLLPSDQKAIDNTMHRLVQAASVQPNESNLARLTYPDRLAGFFTTNAVLHLEALNSEFSSISSRTDLLGAATAARLHLRQAEFKLADLHLTFPGPKGTAHAYVVITGQINFKTNSFGQAFKMNLEKTHGRWLISEVHTVERLQ